MKYVRYSSFLCWFLLLFAGCSSALSPWRYDFIAAGDPRFDSGRLIYTPVTGYPPLRLEFLSVAGQVEIFVSLLQNRFHPSSEDPTGLVLSLSTEEQTLEEKVPLFEGNMKIRLSDSLRAALIQSLQDGQKVSILVDGFQETLDPETFEKNFDKLKGSRLKWLNIRNPLE